MPSLSVGYLLFDVVVFILSASLARSYAAARTRRRCLQYPPGPRRLPILGNLFDIPQYSSWETYTQWGKQYGTVKCFLDSTRRKRSELTFFVPRCCAVLLFYTGDVTSVSVLGRLIVFVNSARAAKDLFERKGTRYADRPVIPIINM
jgi:hypothetical protein